MEALIPARVRSDIEQMVSIAAKDEHAELEVKVLAGQITTKDVADRIVSAIESITSGGATEEHRATFSYSDGLRVHVTGAETILKVCQTGSFRSIPLTVERKRKYFDKTAGSGTDLVDVPDLKLRFTLRHEEQLRKDFSGAPMDPASHVRILHRKSWTTPDKAVRIDMSMVKSKTKQTKTFADILKQTPAYELEVEILDKTKGSLKSLVTAVEPLIAAYQQSAFLLTESDMQRYKMESEAMKIRFVQPVTMERRHILASRPHNVLSGYTVTNKADGERSFLVVARDKRMIRITRSGKVTWTGITAAKDIHIGDVIDGEYLADRNLFCIFDVYQFRGKSTLRLPLMTSDDDILKDPLKSRLGCASLFVDDLRKEFSVLPSRTPLRVETKMFLAGNGPAMQKAINTILDTKFEYPTDGLVFTPRSSPVAPVTDRKGDTWLRVYKWKPADQNSIDFLVRFTNEDSYDPVLKKRVVKGTLFVGRSPGSDLVYPCETLTGEYKPPRLPEDLQVLAEAKEYAPSPFQPSLPKAPDASEILIPVNARGIPTDQEGKRVEDNTILECARDVETQRWVVMRTRYDKTYQYRVLKQAQFGNDSAVAESIWTNIHNPVTEAMIRGLVDSPPDDSSEDDLYYRDSLEARDRTMKDILSFHNKIKEALYQTTIKQGDTLLELAVGRANDLHKWRKTRPSRVVGVDLSQSNLDAPRQGACARYLGELSKITGGKLPPALFIQADMTQPLLEQDNRYLKMLDRREPAPTEYLQKFVGLTDFDVISCQMAMHYACETEETFRTFVGNLTRHGKGLFFGTCLDGAAVYSLLLGKAGHTFRAGAQVFGEFTKEYADGDGWTEEFGKAITVKLESFERPVQEYLLPFGRVTEILKENGFDLIRTSTFGDHYGEQTEYTLTGDQQAFSFLHRTFVFKRTSLAPPKKEEPSQEVTIPTAVLAEPVAEEPKKKKVIKAKVAIETKPEEKPVEPVFFFYGNPALNDTKEFSNLFEAKMLIDGINFPTVEHYFQWAKARKFGDAEIQAKILKTASPKTAKTLGKKVKNFKEEEWNETKETVMKTALKAKFTQHPELLTKLRETGDRPLAEADPRSKEWGIGTSADTSKAKDPARWPGKNKLGTLLMNLRTELRE